MVAAAALKAERATTSLVRLRGSERDEAAWLKFLVGAGEKKRLSEAEMARRDAQFERVVAPHAKADNAVRAAQAAEKEAIRARVASADAMARAPPRYAVSGRNPGPPPYAWPMHQRA